MHRTRIITSIVGLAILIAIVSVGNLLVFWAVVSSVIVLGLLEFYHIAAARELPVYTLPGVLLGWMVSLTPLFSKSFEETRLTDFTFSLVVLSLMLYALFAKRSLAECIPALAITLFGILYVAWLLNHLVFLRALPDGKRLVFYLLLVVWAGDTGAYYSGSFFGKHKLAPTISPKKTIEGAIGSFASSVLASGIAKWTFLPTLSAVDCVILGMILSFIAQCGDLCESLLKRGANVKDSGAILPGHGGMLDRLDGVMFAAPVLYYYALLFLTV